MSLYRFKEQVLLIAILFISYTGYCQNNIIKEGSLSTTFMFFVDSTNRLALPDISKFSNSFTPLDSFQIKASYAYTYWLKGEIISENTHDSLVFLQVGNLDEVTLYSAKDSMQNGRTIHPDKKVMKGEPYFFPVKKNQIFYLKLNNRQFVEYPLIQPQVSTTQHTLNIIENNAHKRFYTYYLFGLMAGILLAFFIYPLTLYLFDSKIYLLYYGLYVLFSFFFFVFIFERYNHLDLFFSYYPEILNYYEREINTTQVLLYLLFFWTFFKDQFKSIRTARIVYYSILLFYAISIYCLSSKFFSNDPYFIERNLIPNTFSGLLFSIVSIYCVLRIKSVEAKLVGIGFVIYLVGMWTTIYYYFGYAAKPIENPHIYYQIGILGELLFFALALSYRNKRIIQQNENEKIQLQNLNEFNLSKTKLYTNITHEFRTPLTVILGLVEQLKYQPQFKIQERLQIINNNGKRLLKLVNELMDLSQLDAGNLKLQYIQGDLLIYLGFIVNSFKHLAQSKNIHLTFYAEQSSLIMDFDEDKLQQIIANLIHNAIKFTPEYGEITLAVRIIDKQVQIMVKDSGIGIPKAKQAQIFDRFYQVNDTSIREEEGSGIGLTIVKELLELMQGEITLLSDEKKGSTFRIILPITNKAPLQEKDWTSNAFNSIIGEASVLQNEDTKPFKSAGLILLVEDNLDVIYFLKSCLDHKYETIIARNGVEGFKMAKELSPNLIITDIMMPKMDGFELIKLLKSELQTQHIPVLITTAKATKIDRLNGLKLGAATYINKPFSREELLLQIEKALTATTFTPPNTLATTSTTESQYLKKLYEVIEANLDNEQFYTPELAQKMALSRTQLYRKTRALTGQAPSELIRSIRLEKASKLLQATNLNIGSIASQTGFKDASYFSKVFFKAFKQSPTAYRRNRNRNEVE